MKIILTITRPGGIREYRSFPFDPNRHGSKETAFERLELFRRSLGKEVRTTWEIRQSEAIAV